MKARKLMEKEKNKFQWKKKASMEKIMYQRMDQFSKENTILKNKILQKQRELEEKRDQEAQEILLKFNTL